MLSSVQLAQFSLTDGSQVEIVASSRGNKIAVLAIYAEIPDGADFVVKSASTVLSLPFHGPKLFLSSSCDFPYFETASGEALTASASGLSGNTIEGMVWYVEVAA